MAKGRALTQLELEAFLDESLAPEEMARIEMALRTQPQMARALVEISSRRDMGVHSLGEIWRRHRVSCPARQHLGSYLLDTLDSAAADYVRFHIETVGCRVCQANLADLRQQQEETRETSTSRRRKYFQSSAGYLRRDRTS
ncbi:MAG: hypothetical protein AB7O38_22605 [Pirellulaceae bacterium]